MNQPGSLAEIADSAVAHSAQLLASGQYAEAEGLLRDVLAADGRNHRAMHLLAKLACHVARYDIAEHWMTNALALAGGIAAYHVTLGRIRKGQGRLTEAEASLRRALALDHRDADAHVMLGLVLKAGGQVKPARKAFETALRLRPGFPEAQINLANLLREEGAAAEAATLYEQAAAAAPDLAEAQSALAASRVTEGRYDEALAQYRRALELQPRQPNLEFMRGCLLLDKADRQEAIAAFRKAVALNPQFADAWVSLGLALAQAGEALDGLNAFRQAIAVQPDHVDAHINYAASLAAFGAMDENLRVLRHAETLAPENVTLLGNLGAALIAVSRLEEAAGVLRRAVAVAPDWAPAVLNLGAALRGPGVQEESLRLLRRAAELEPNSLNVHGNLLMALCYNDRVTAEEILAATRYFGRQKIANPGIDLVAEGAATASPEEPRRLRIGYVSPDLRDHSVAYFVEPVLRWHDRQRFEVFCYYCKAVEDDTSARLKALTDQWHNVFAVPDEALARRIHADGIDILVDLAGHTADGRLGTFACRPAPVQVAWLGFPTTTGLPAMDYRITDGLVDPPGQPSLNTETPLRLPDSYFCYQPGAAPDVGPLPATQNGYITFGSFNSLVKFSDSTVRLWAAVLARVPGSRLLLKNRFFGEPAMAERIRAAFAREGVAGERIELLAFAKEQVSHLEIYNRVDIGLDSWPYNGATTTCEALWMGVPVVNRCGGTHASRMGLTILSTVGLGDLVTAEDESFVARAVALAGDLERLVVLRAGLRRRLADSPLMQGEAYTRALEALYEQACQSRCMARSSTGIAG
ncbi:MAG TPA: tetratricopeptide repeat protein [Rhodocyclaceae bacterium]|nr:tetratricopeptide repeat protein [Rhodocyclaceae bacterium]